MAHVGGTGVNLPFPPVEGDGVVSAFRNPELLIELLFQLSRPFGELIT
jgi:hypothetical protein